jgi:hypothetical protein
MSRGRLRREWRGNKDLFLRFEFNLGGFHSETNNATVKVWEKTKVAGIGKTWLQRMGDKGMFFFLTKKTN